MQVYLQVAAHFYVLHTKASCDQVLTCQQMPILCPDHCTHVAAGPQAPKQAPVYDMRCALMNLSLPVEPLALQLLQ